MQAAIILNHDILNFSNIGQGEAQRSIKVSSLVAVRHMTNQTSRPVISLGSI